ncbi:MAG: NUDIX hydrolase [Solirubrobacteraceae bacterium]
MKEKVIYFLEKPIILSKIKEKNDFINLKFTSDLIFRNALTILKKTPAKGVNIYYNNEKDIWKRFKNCFPIVEAAGGVVLNEKKEKLFIKRLEHWDLPKGKIELGESKNKAAIREVEEETGIVIDKSKRKIKNTYHIYQAKNKRFILKKVTWFEMFTTYNKKLKPQLEEGIVEAKWLNDNQIADRLDKMYKNISLLLSKFYEEEHSKTSSK